MPEPADTQTPAVDPVVEEVRATARRARTAARALALLTRAEKDAALRAVADALVARTAEIVAANAEDLSAGRERGLPEGLLDRLLLDEGRITAIAEAVRDVAALPDPVGEVVRGFTRPNGIQLRQVRVPMGVVGMIYEARPNVTVDAAALALKSGNAAILRGGSAAARSNAVIVEVIRGALERQGLPADAVSTAEGGHEAARALMTARGLVDLVIPRGGADLIRTVVEQSTVPVIETGTGVCHVYVDAAADPVMAADLVVNSKTQRTAVCNAAETLLVHADAAEAALPGIMAGFARTGVTVHGDEAMRPYAEAAGVPFHPVTEADDAAEYYSLDIAARVVPDLDAALAHIARWGTGHTEAIVTGDRGAARRFAAEVDAAVVAVNASTRFTDGAEFGFGAEIGISTQKLHARGPMALAELTTTKWLLEGDGQTRG